MDSKNKYGIVHETSLVQYIALLAKIRFMRQPNIFFRYVKIIPQVTICRQIHDTQVYS